MGVQVRLPTVILTISPNDVPRSVPVMVTVVPPSVGPLSGEIPVIIGGGQLLDVVTKFVEQVAEPHLLSTLHHPHKESLLATQLLQVVELEHVSRGNLTT